MRFTRLALGLVTGLFVVWAAVPASGQKARVGSVVVELPPPGGLVPVPASASAFREAIARSVFAANSLLDVYVTAADLPAVDKGGKGAAVVRYAMAQTPKAGLGMTVTEQDFGQLTQIIADQNGRVYQGLDQQVRQIFDEINVGKRPMDERISLDSLVPLPPHRAEPSVLAFSMVAMTTYGEGKAARTGVITTTATIVLVRSKVLFLYVYGGRDDLEWTRAAGAEWSRTVQTANASLAPKD
jgi:hypothetical protein